MATRTTQVSGSLITHNYKNFSGVDFANRGDEVSNTRSPDSLNMWRNYNTGRCVETRPDIELFKKYNDTIYGLFFYEYNNEEHLIVHSGNKLYNDDKVIYEGMNEHRSNFFVFSYKDLEYFNDNYYRVINWEDNKLYILDGNKYLVYDGILIKEVEGYIPRTSISRQPLGGGVMLDDVNLLSDYRKNSFCSDGVSLSYYLDSDNIDKEPVRVWINGEEISTGFSTNYEDGIVTFETAPEAPLTDGQDNVFIQYKKSVLKYRKRIENCTLVELFDNRVFFSGNSDYPNVLFHCSLNDPTYISDLDYYEEGANDSGIKSLVSGNNALWVMKEPSQSNTTVFYHTPIIDSDYGKIYPSTHSSISTGCVSRAINFNDAICFYSPNGLERISGDVTTEQVITHASTLVDSKLLNEEKYKDVIFAEWKGYLLSVIGSKIYLADSRNFSEVNNHYEYEWFYWEFDEDITDVIVNDEILYLIMDKTIYTLTKTNGKVFSYWETLEDEFGYPEYQKITNKKGCVVDMEGEEISVYARTDNKDFSLIKTYQNTKGYVVPRIKKKKWKSIQLKFSSNKPFKLYSNTLEAYVGSYVKR